LLLLVEWDEALEFDPVFWDVEGGVVASKATDIDAIKSSGKNRIVFILFSKFRIVVIAPPANQRAVG
jgi:hypothetical protein